MGTLLLILMTATVLMIALTEKSWVINVCPPPLAFNPAIFNCDFPDHVDGCNKKITKDVNPCEDVTDPNQSTAADPEDCHCFYDCAGEVAMEHHCCAEGLAFDPVLLVCDWEANIDNCN